MKKGFTLAEVLVTLAIIGVVAALTIPTLVQDYKIKVYETAFKTNRAKLAQVIKLMMANEGADSLTQLSYFAPCLGQGFDCQDIAPDLSKYIKVLKYTGERAYKTLKGTPLEDISFGFGLEDCTELKNCYQMNDGSIIRITSHKTKPYAAGGEPYFQIALDTNGEKGPNQLGRDAFMFRVNNSGNLIGYGENGLPQNYQQDLYETTHWSVTCNPNLTTKDIVMQQGGMTEEEFDEGWNSLTEEEQKQFEEETVAPYRTIAEMGIGCAGRIVEKGKMDY